MVALYPFLRPPDPYTDIDVWQRFFHGAVYIGIALTPCGAVAFAVMHWRRDRTPPPTWWTAALPVARLGAAPLITGALAGGLCEAWWRQVCGSSCVSLNTIGAISWWVALWTLIVGAGFYALAVLMRR